MYQVGYLLCIRMDVLSLSGWILCASGWIISVCVSRWIPSVYRDGCPLHQDGYVLSRYQDDYSLCIRMDTSSVSSSTPSVVVGVCPHLPSFPLGMARQAWARLYCLHPQSRLLSPNLAGHVDTWPDAEWRMRLARPGELSTNQREGMTESGQRGEEGGER